MNDSTIEVESVPQNRELKGFHVLLIMLGFFGIMFAVNGVFLYQALTTFPGEETKRSYLQGLNYNAALAERDAQASLGWRAQAGLEDNNLIFRLQDSDENPASGLRVTATIRRPATNSDTLSAELRETKAGEYRYVLNDLATGEWKIAFTVLESSTDEIVFQANKTVHK